jgi:uncharacterized membrane protein
LAYKQLKGAGLLLMILSLSAFAFGLLFVSPHFSHSSYLYQGNYSVLLKNPIAGLSQRLCDPKAIGYVMKMFSPLLFLSFLHFPTLMLTLPVLLQNLLSANETMRSLNYHYTTGLTPFVFVSSIYGLSFLLKKYSFFYRRSTVLALALLMVSLMSSGSSEYYFFWKSTQHMTPHNSMVINKLRSVPSSESVLTHNNFVAQLPNRKRVYQFDYTLQKSKAEMARELNVNYVVLDMNFWEKGTLPLSKSLGELQDSGYRVEYENDGFYVMKKGMVS